MVDDNYALENDKKGGKRMGYLNKKIFKETCFNDKLDNEREELLKKYAEIHMPGVAYLSCKKRA